MCMFPPKMNQPQLVKLNLLNKQVKLQLLFSYVHTPFTLQTKMCYEQLEANFTSECVRLQHIWSGDCCGTLILFCHIHRFFPHLFSLHLSIFLLAFHFASVILILTYVVWQRMMMESVFFFLRLKVESGW